ncbi:DUF433 domain-containing protein [Microbacterium invictum]|uniref:Uncharacterized protein (DUF433 family) n=1 Tax=Microbacterium invictum TaxID=515415 RepID=A0AA40SRE5_9MICO|nr:MULTISPECIES: DUF433 domain-containing protein [Microbacterium]MBB4141037.1 uncharacterized protein (DUF433 family) [Microbacterium invictum]
MSFNVALTSVLSGASVRQLGHWRKTELLVPEVNSASRPILYSFRDILALRAVVKLRQDQSLQKIRKAFATLPHLDLTEHPAQYALVNEGSTIALVRDDGSEIDLVTRPGHAILVTLPDIMNSFETHRGAVVDLRRPREHLRVREQWLGGWPTIEGTRVPYDTIAELLSDGTIEPSDVGHYYPGVTAAAARDALDFARSVPGWRESIAA